jgi:HTH-type transcriptional regulator, transcriptional repressor of NAD biosynthesis genes
MSVGLVVGKFAPLHRGHQGLIEAALAETDEVVVAVYDTPTYEPAAARRADWIRAIYPAARVQVLDDPEPAGTADEVSAAYAAHFLQHHRGPRVTHVFSGEDYGDRFARALGATHVRRPRTPVSGTLVRADPWAHRDSLEPLVYRDLVARICLLGAESTGKTTLAAALAQDLGTVWVPEYGRELWEAKDAALEYADLLEIAREQLRREDAAAEKARGFLLCDTNALATVFWSDFLFGRVDPELHELADRTAAGYRYLLCDNDFGWLQDGTRVWGGGAEWKGHQHAIRADLERRGFPYVEVSGQLEQRVEAVKAWLRTLSPKRAPVP